MTWYATQTLTAPTPQAGGRFGTDVALAADAPRAAISEMHADTYATGGGAGHVFLLSGTWTHEATLEPVPNGTLGAGGTRAISIDHAGAAVALGMPDQVIDVAACNIYNRSGTSWALDWILTGGASHLGFGSKLSGDGTVLTAGMPYADLTPDCGALRSCHNREDITIPGEPARKSTAYAADQAKYERLGYVLDVSGDGLTCAVRRSPTSGAADMSKRVSTFRYNYYAGRTYSPDSFQDGDFVETLTNPSGVVNFGVALTLSEAGARLGVGDNKYDSNTGRAWIYALDPSTALTSLLATLTPPAGVAAADGNLYYASAAALTPDATTLAVAAPGADVGAVANAGCVCLYRTSDAGATWDHVATVTDPTPETGAWFGACLGFDRTGNLLVGAPLATVSGAAEAGRAIYYTIDPTLAPAPDLLAAWGYE